MKKFYYLFCFSLCISLATKAQELGTLTYAVNNGTYYNADGTLTTERGFEAKKFIFNGTPAITIEGSTEKPLNYEGVGSASLRIGFSTGTASISITAPNGYVITGYTLKFKNMAASHPVKTLTSEEGTSITTQAENTKEYTLSHSNIYKQTTYFTVTTTGWSPINITSFTISYQSVVPSGYYRLLSKTGKYISYGEARTTSASRGTGLVAVDAANKLTDPGTILKFGKNGDSSYTISTQNLWVKSQTTANYPFPLGSESETSTFNFIVKSAGNVALKDDASKNGADLTGCLHDATGDTWTVPAIVNWNENGANSLWTIEPATSINVTLNEGGDGFYYATRYFDFPVSADNGLYILTSGEDGDVVTAEKVAAVPAKTGFLIRSTSSPITLNIPTTEPAGVTSYLNGNCLATTTLPSGTIYVFSKVDDELGFFQYTGSDLPANRAYIVDSGSSTRTFVLNFNDELTGINTSLDKRQPSQAYDLQGRRISIGNAKGLYIQNGKKILK